LATKLIDEKLQLIAIFYSDKIVLLQLFASLK